MKQIKKTSVTKEIPKFAYIDALRGVAILGVLIFHAGPNFQTMQPHWFGVLISQGARGVQLFYVLSALTLFLSFTNRSSFENHPIRNFYIRRFFRITPLFYLAIIYYLWQNYFFGPGSFFSFTSIFTTFIFVNGVSPYWINAIVPGGWSITVEMTFYLMFPLLFYIIKNVSRAIFVTALTIISMQIFRLYLLSIDPIENYGLWQEFTFLFFPSQLPLFLIGILTYFFIREKNNSAILKTLFVLTVTLLLQIIFKIPIIAGHYIYGFVFLLLCVLLARPSATSALVLYQLLVNRVSCFLGKISFSLYLSHFAVLFWLNYFGFFNFLPNYSIHNYFLNLFILIFSSTLISIISYKLIEEPGQKLGKKVIFFLNRS